MSKTYVIGDLHGRFDLLAKALNVIPESGTIITLGDYIDRGPQSCEIIETLRERQSEKFISLMGNHEDMMIQCLEGRAPIGWWYGNGGDATEVSYIQAGRSIYDDIKWVAGLPLVFEDKHRIYVHAGIDPQISLEKQDRETLLWKMYNHNTWIGHIPSGKWVVHGHVQSNKHPIAKTDGGRSGRVAMDTFAFATGRLVVGVFDDDLSCGPVEYLEVLGEARP